MIRMVTAVVVVGSLALSAAAAEPKTGERPYEMVWANRNQDDHPPLVDFEDLAGWTVAVRNSVASLERTREQQLWGQYVGKLTYRGTGPGPEVTVQPPAPVAIPGPFDAVSCWIYGNNWSYASDPSTPPVTVQAVFQDSAGKEFKVYLTHVVWEEWFLCHHRLSPDLVERVRAGASFTGLLVTGGRNREDRVLFVDNLAVFTEGFPPLTFEPRPERGIPMFPGQGTGTNTGPGKLPFPTRPETILPDNLTRDSRTRLQEVAGGFSFEYEGADGKLAYRLEPKTGMLDDLSASWAAGGTVRPCVGGGVWLVGAKGPVAPEKAEPVETRRVGDTVVSRWRLTAGATTVEATFTYRLWGKSLVIDVAVPGGQVAEVRYGRATGLVNPRLVTNPFYPAAGGRPAVAVSGPDEAPLFLTGNTDWYLSNASEPFAANAVDDGGVLYNGGTRYIPKTDGRRNDCYERFFLTLSPVYEEVLPTIPNPVSPWKKVTGTHVWRAHGAGNRESDAEHWRNVHRWGMTECVITDHETGWRDGGESFTFRTRTAPRRGGDESQFRYARIMQDELGFVYGPYNNYTDFAPVNEFWSADLIARTPDSQLQTAWMRCYAPKPARAVEYCARLAPIIQEKFHFSTAYCDVHTAVAPWHRVDYDARVPGAGTFSAVFYSYGEIMLHQKKAWDGPVYSEGNHHSFYSGLTDGNYGQDQAYKPAVNPWLVDFDLRKMHDLCCNFGMGSPEMFYANQEPPRRNRAEMDAWLDRFLAATVAFGHPGFLTLEGGMQNGLRGYYMLQQLHSRYCLASAETIRYADGQGRLLDTSRAVGGGAHRRSQVVTRYTDGTVTAANGSPSERLAAAVYGRSLDLPPNGYAGWTEDGQVDVLSTDTHGRRFDYARTPAYLYIDGRGRMIRYEHAAGNGIGICRFLPDQGAEVLLWQTADCGFRIRAESAVALDKASKEIGPATLRNSRGLTYVTPVADAFSYRLAGVVREAPAVALTCDRDDVVPGETVTVKGREAHALTIPADAKAGERVWREFEGAWIDFTVVPLADVALAIDGTSLVVDLNSNLGRLETFTVSTLDRQASARLEPGVRQTVRLDLGAPTHEDAAALVVEIRAADLGYRVERGLRTVSQSVRTVDLPEAFEAGMCVRGGTETTDFGETRAFAHTQSMTSGDVTKPAIGMHPPWVGAVGYAYALYPPVALPAQPPLAFRAVVGKGDGSDPGDGILYKVTVREPGGPPQVVAELLATAHQWVPLAADLSAWAGRTVRIQLVSDVGKDDDSSGDWACWAEMRVETLVPVLTRVLEEDAERFRHEPGPKPLPGITVDLLRQAKQGWLRYDGCGLEGNSPTYGTVGVLNGAELGAMTRAGGDETNGIWDCGVGVPLTPAAIASLAMHNTFVLQNPRRDCFKVRRFWIELELADGRSCSSEVSTAAYTQPPSWAYAEGILVPHGTDITVDIWFRP